MKLPLLAAAALLSIVPACFADDPVPCEDMLAKVKEAAKTAQLTDADKAKVADLQDQGIERCKADDDKNADDLFTQALKIMGQQ